MDRDADLIRDQRTGLGPDSERQRIRRHPEAFATWEAVTSADIEFDFEGTIAERSVGLDGTNLITFADDSDLLGTTTLAATFSWFRIESGDVVFREADIAFNPVFDLTTSGEANRFDIQGVLTHEIGHMLGLDHSGIISSVMAPFASPEQIDQRTLQYDDMAGVGEIYPNADFARGVGSITGRVRSNSVPVFGAHVVAMNEDGTSLVAILSDEDGEYELGSLPPGDYRIYAEPLDLPVSSDQLPGFFNGIRTDFDATYFGGTRFLADAPSVAVSADTSTRDVDIDVFSESADFNLTRPVFAQRVERTGTETVRVGGTDVVAGTSFSFSAPGITLDEPVFGGRISRTARTSATLSVTASTDVPLGPKSVTGLSGGSPSVLSGVLVITDPRPSEIEVAPSAGAIDGGTVVTIIGQDFRPGLSVLFRGLPGEDLEFLNSGMLQATVPRNSPGPANVHIINPDGTWGLLEDGFDYLGPPPAILTVEPLLGPPTTLVTIEGENFDIRCQNVEVRFNGVRANVIGTTRTQIQTVVPFGATTGDVTVEVFGVIAQGPLFMVTELGMSSNVAPAGFRFVDASPAAGGTELDFINEDDSVFFMELPFSFSLFTDTFVAGTRISIATNGWLSLEGASLPEFQNAALPAKTVDRPSGSEGTIPPALIASYFDDLILVDDARVATLVTGDPGERQFVVQWEGTSILDSVGTDLGADLTFQAVLFEGSNDIQFAYQQMLGPQSDGSSTTIGVQSLLRNRAVQSGFNQSIVGSGVAVTYRFVAGEYLEEISDFTSPSTPLVTDGGERTSDATVLFASWVAEETESEIREFQYAIGTTPGGEEVLAFASTENNSVVVKGLSLAEGVTYYFAVRAVNTTGLASKIGTSDGIVFDPTFVPVRKIFPSLPSGNGSFGGLAFVAASEMDVVLRAINTDGTLPMAPGVRNPTAIHLEAGEQLARLVGELIGLTSFNGWIELEASSEGLDAYAASGRDDLRGVDGVRPSLPSTSFYLLHAGAAAFLVNPGSETTTVTITRLDDGTSLPLEIPARSRRTTPLETPVLISSPSPVAAAEFFGSDFDLAIGNAIEPEPLRSLVFPQAVVGGGYRSWVTLANRSGSARNAKVAFLDANRFVEVPGDGVVRFSLGDLFGLSSTEILADAVHVTVSSIFGLIASLVGVIDIETDASLVTLQASAPGTEFLFPQVADGGGFFTGIAIATGSAETEVLVEVFPPSGQTPKITVVKVEADGYLANLISELVPEAAGQSGGYIRLTADEPIWAWEIFGTHEAMASGPP